MPGLLTLKTDLKSLKYGQDTPGGGDSGQPYIKTDINTVDRGFNRFRLTRFDDGLVRGGVVGTANAAIVDTLRIGKFFVDFPKGPLFLVKQVGLQLSNPQLEHIDTLPTNRTGTNRPTRGQGFLRNTGNLFTNVGTSIGAFIANTANRIENAVGPTRIYNLGINTLAQVPLNAIGGHIMRHGFLPTNDESKLYYNVVRINNFQNNHNRLEGYAGDFKLGGFAIKKEWDSVSTEITSYISGPSSVYGIGNTSIRKSYDAITNNWDKISGSLEFSKIKTSNSYPSQVLSKTGGIQGLENYLYTFSIFSSTSNNIQSYTNNIKRFNSLINTQVTNRRNNLSNPPAPSSTTSTIPTTPAITARVFTYKVKPSLDIKGDETSRTWRTPDELEERLNKSNDRSTNLLEADDFNTITSGGQTSQQFPSRLLGLSKLDSDLRMSAIDMSTGTGATIYDQTAVLYSDIQPSLRKYSELVDTVNNTIEGKQVFGSSKLTTPLLNIIKSDNLLKQNKLNNQLASAGGVPLRDVSSTAFSTDTVSRNSNGNRYITYYNGIQGDNPVVIKFSNWSEASREKRIGSGRQDEINLTPIFSEGAHFGGDGTNNQYRDLVKFRIQAVNTDSPGSGQWMVFRAYLTDLSDDTTPEWTDVKYAGRGDKFYIYNGFTRKINIGFKVAALSEKEMKFIYQKLNFLMGNAMPDYSGVLMRGPLVRMTVGNWIDCQLGKIDSISFKVPQDSPWEIAIDEPEGGKKKLILPHIVEVTLGFTPIGSETRGNNLISEKSTTTSHIAQNNTGKDIGTLQYIG